MVATFKRHIRMSLLGRLPGPEIFSMNIALAPGGDGFNDGYFLGNPLSPNSTVWDDLARDAATFFGTSKADNVSVLERVKFAFIAPNGEYEAAPIERLVNAPNGTPGSTGFNNTLPNQTAWTMTLHTDGDMKRVKGRFYLPRPHVVIGTDGLVTETERNTQQAGLQTFLNALNNQPGFDVLDIRAVVASQGRRNRDGSVRLPPQNHIITGCSVGRALDTIRARRSKLQERRTAPAAVS